LGGTSLRLPTCTTESYGGTASLPLWDRFGSFAGQLPITGTMVWLTAERRVVIEGRRGDQRFEEVV
jgi:hypothetical protein